MIENTSLQYLNVYSKVYCVKEWETKEAFDDFSDKISQLKGESGGSFFYSINGVNEEKEVVMELFMPMKDKYDIVTGLRFRSYFVIDRLTSIIVNSDYEENIDDAYITLIQYAEKRGKKIISPFYNVVHTSKDCSYISVHVLMRENDSQKE